MGVVDLGTHNQHIAGLGTARLVLLSLVVRGLSSVSENRVSSGSPAFAEQRAVGAPAGRAGGGRNALAATVRTGAAASGTTGGYGRAHRGGTSGRRVGSHGKQHLDGGPFLGGGGAARRLPGAHTRWPSRLADTVARMVVYSIALGWYPFGSRPSSPDLWVKVRSLGLGVIQRLFTKLNAFCVGIPVVNRQLSVVSCQLSVVGRRSSNTSAFQIGGRHNNHRMSKAWHSCLRRFVHCASVMCCPSMV